MANVSVTNTFVSGTTILSGQMNQNFTDIINGTSDGTKDFNINALTASGTITFDGLTASRGLWTNAASVIATGGIDSAKIIFGTGSDAEMFHDGTNLQIDPQAAGATTAFIINESGNDVDLRVEGATATQMFVVNAGDDTVNIGTTTEGNTAIFGGSSILLKRATTLTGAITANGSITLGGGFDLIGSSTSDITFNTNKLKWDSANNRLAVGTAAPTADLHILGGGTEETAAAGTVAMFQRTTDATAGCNIDIVGGATSGTSSVSFGDTNSLTVGMIQYAHGSNSMAFQTDDSERMRIASDGKVGIKTTGATVDLHVLCGGTAMAGNASTVAIFQDTSDNTAGADIAIVAGNSSGVSSVSFGDLDDADIGLLKYLHATNSFEIHTAAIKGFTMDGNQDCIFTGSITVSDNIKIQADNKKILFGAGDDASILYDGTDMVINPKEVGSGKVNVSGDVSLNTDNGKVFFGAGEDASILYDGTDLVIDPKEVGSGVVSVSGTLDATALSTGNETFTYDEGTFTATATGLITSPTATAHYVICGSLCTVFLPAITGTSNLTTFTYTGAPAAITPTREQDMPIINLEDNTAFDSTGGVVITAGGVFQFTRYDGTNYSVSNWTGSGTKGMIRPVAVSYLLN